MSIKSNKLYYSAPETNLLDLLPGSILCASGDGPNFGSSLEDMEENDYIFTW
jgi:hypothetical protein